MLDLYATSVDYDPRSSESVAFFKMVQNKLHYAAHGHTAAEVIYERADADKPFMGLTAFSGGLAEAGSVGIRPEALKVTTGPVPEGAFSGKAEVTGILPTGGSWIVELTVPGGKLFQTTHEMPEIEQGETVSFWVEPRALHVFDKAGNRSATADQALRPARRH